MDPNSQHQQWSKWMFRVSPGIPRQSSLGDVRTNCLRFAKKAWGSTGRLRVTQRWHPAHGNEWTVEAIVEGHPAHDPKYRDYMLKTWETFFVAGFGVHTRILAKTRLLAGDPQIGTPREQWIELPSLSLLPGVK